MSIRPRLVSSSLALVAAGAATGVFLAGPADGAPPRPVPTFAFDEDFTVQMRASVARNRVKAGTIVVQDQEGGVAAATTRLGTFCVDPSSKRRVVVRPEAVREYFQIVRGLSRIDADKAAEKLLRDVTRSGNWQQFRRTEQSLKDRFSVTYGAGMRLDDPNVFGMIPPQVGPSDRLAAYRRLFAGDDALWAAAVGGDAGAYAQLVGDTEAERFHHDTDPETGLPYPESALRRREHRRVLVGGDPTKVTFIPRVPVLADLSDTTYAPSTVYTVTVARSLGRPDRLLPGAGAKRAPFNGQYSLFSTFAAGHAFADREGAKPRIVTVTPPFGETLVDPTSDWEDPEFPVPGAGELRRPFRIRLRFASPLRPDSITPWNFTLYRTVVGAADPTPMPVHDKLEVTVNLRQTRLGEVCVDVTPVETLPPNSSFEVNVNGLIKSLGGELMNTSHRFTFDTR